MSGSAANPSDEQVLAAAQAILAVVQQAVQDPERAAQIDSVVPGAVKEIFSGKNGGTMGAQNLLIHIKLKNPTWELSEKRFKRILKANGIQTGEGGSSAEEKKEANGAESNGNGHASSDKKKKKKKSGNKHAKDIFVPSSKVDSTLPLPSNVETHFFNSVKGKGLVATRDFKEGEIIFTEDAYIPSPPAHVLKHVVEGELCDYCFLPINHPAAAAQSEKKAGLSGMMSVDCSHKKEGCQAKWCNRLCWQRAMVSHHPLLCAGANPLIRQFLSIVLQLSWGAAYLSARALARVLLTHSNKPTPSLLEAKTSETNAASVAALSGAGAASSATNPVKPASAEEVLAHLNAFATVDELARRSRTPAWQVEEQQFIHALSECHKALAAALNPYAPEREDIERQAKQPLNTENAANIRIAKRIIADYPVRPSFPQKLAEQIFHLDSWCKMLGRANINTENHGSLYLVQSQINHSCAPNCAVRHIPIRGGIKPATKISVMAMQEIKKGDELLITYVNLGAGEDGSPGPDLRRRRLMLWREYMFGPCECPRCLQELASMDEEQRKEVIAETKSGDWKRDAAQEAAVARQLAQMKLEQEQQGQQGESAATKQNDLAGLGDELKSALGY